jgi:hypothetical protein
MSLLIICGVKRHCLVIVKNMYTIKTLSWRGDQEQRKNINMIINSGEGTVKVNKIAIPGSRNST